MVKHALENEKYENMRNMQLHGMLNINSYGYETNVYTT